MITVGILGILLMPLSTGVVEGSVPDPVGTRAYNLHLPPGGAGGKPLVVYLHGCTQSIEEAEAATGFSTLADLEGFAVLYVAQNVTEGTSAPLADGNGMGCWNWFLPENQQRGSGEAAIITGLTLDIVGEHDIDADRVYIAGISAGAMMAVNLAAAYPDVYAAAGIVAGCPYATCTDLSGSLAFEAMGEQARVVPMFVVQGSADTLNPITQGHALVHAWLGTADWADDGLPNGSVSRVPASVTHHGTDQSPEPGSGDACIRPRNWPCLGGLVGFQDTYPYTVSRYEDTDSCGVVEYWLVHGLGHAQPNAASGPFTDPLGPNVTTATYDFFRKHRMGDPCG